MPMFQNDELGASVKGFGLRKPSWRPLEPSFSMVITAPYVTRRVNTAVVANWSPLSKSSSRDMAKYSLSSKAAWLYHECVDRASLNDYACLMYLLAYEQVSHLFRGPLR